MALNSVFIIESEGAGDLVDRRTEGEGLQRLLSLCNRKSTLRKVTTRQEFEREINIFAASGCNILHLSCHGNEAGIGFTDGSTMTWAQLFAVLDGNISDKYLFLSSCAPMSNSRLIDLFGTSDRPPFLIAGSTQSLTWRDAFVAWTLLYNALSCKETPLAIRNALAAYHLVSDGDFRVQIWALSDKKGEPPICLGWSAADEYQAVVQSASLNDPQSSNSAADGSATEIDEESSEEGGHENDNVVVHRRRNPPAIANSEH